MSPLVRPEEGLRSRFLTSATRRLTEVLRQIDEFERKSETSLLDQAARQLHIVKGDAKLLGFDAIHAAAEDVEGELQRDPGESFSARAQRIRAGIAALERVVADGATAAAPVSNVGGRRHGIRGDGEPWRILLIDDSEIALEVQREVLEEAGFEVRGTTALGTFDELLADWCPQVILADVDMPTMSGPELCRMLKGRYDTAHVPIVLCSALSNDRLRQLARDCEAEGYVSKARLETLAEDLYELCEAMAW